MRNQIESFDTKGVLCKLRMLYADGKFVGFRVSAYNNYSKSRSAFFVERLFRVVQRGESCFRLSLREKGWLFIELPGSKIPKELDCFRLPMKEYSLISSFFALSDDLRQMHPVREIGNNTFTFRYTTVAYSKTLARPPKCAA